ncbi:MAG: hypothetical protein EP308_04515 [Burkholderiales bacterium]|nr:MAG: hypothetical protein EP308_04515 [Burkholderiales bacterium]
MKEPFMPIFSMIKWRIRPHVLALSSVAAVVVSACGGGSDGPSDVDPGGASPSTSIHALAGDWVQVGCVSTGRQSFKKFLRARITGQAALDYHEGVLTFGGTECRGASVLAGPSRLGTVTVEQSRSNDELVAHWGVFRTVTGTRSGAIWTLRPGNLLCLLGDEIPTIQPSLSAVSASLATVPRDNCFSR